MAALFISTLLLACTDLAACDPINLSPAEQDLANAINQLATESWNFEGVLTNLDNQILLDAPQLLSQVGYITEGATASIGTESRCDMLFLGELVKRTLQNIRIVNFHPDQKLLPPVPFPCKSTPASLRVSDINAGIDGSDVLDVEGFDFDPSWLDHRFPKGTVAVQVESVSPDGTTITSTPVPNDKYVTVHDFDISINFNHVRGFPLTNNSTKVDVYFNGDSNDPFSVLVTPGTVQPTPLTLRSISAIFNTTDNGKAGNSVLTVSIGEGLARYQQPPSQWMPFYPWSTAELPLNEASQPLPLADLEGAPVLICITPSPTGDTWNFDLTITGIASDSRVFSVFLPGNHVTEDPALRCTRGLVMPGDLALSNPPPTPPPGNHPPPTPSPDGGCSAVIAQLTHQCP